MEGFVVGYIHIKEGKGINFDGDKSEINIERMLEKIKVKPLEFLSKIDNELKEISYYGLGVFFLPDEMLNHKKEYVNDVRHIIWKMYHGQANSNKISLDKQVEIRNKVRSDFEREWENSLTLLNK